MRPRARSLRLKLTVWYLVVFSAIQLTLVFGFVLSRWDDVRRSSDAVIEGSAEVMVNNILVTQPDWTNEQVAALVPDDAGFVLFAVRDADGEILAVSENVLEASELPFSAWEMVPSGPVGDVFRTIVSERADVLVGIGADLRLVTLPFRTSESGSYFLQAAVRDNPLHFGPFYDLIRIGIPAGLLAALVASWFIAGRAVAPIRRLSDAARSVSQTRLGGRIQVETTDDEISKLQMELNSALERLEAGYRAQEEFISNVSHELKTPIAVLLTETQILRLGTESIERYRTHAERVEEEMKGLAQLVESFLTLTRCDLAAGLLRGDPVSVNDIVLDSIERATALSSRHQVRVVPKLVAPSGDEEGPVVSGDPDLLRTMLDNLVRNAIRHSPEGADVQVDVQRADGAVSLSVRDSGPGIPSEYVDRVFDRFFQIPEGPAREGTGIGLSIAHNVAHLHGGRISVSNNEDGGCTFVVRLPLAALGGLESNFVSRG